MNAQELWGYLAGVVGIVVGMAGWFRNARGDAKSEANWIGMVNAKLDHISNELMKLNGIRERVAVLERDVRTAFQRQDELRAQIREKELR